MTSSRPNNTYNTNRKQRIAEMDDGFLSSCPFHRKSEEDPELFLRHFQKWVQFKNYSDQASNAFPLLLHDSAKIWFDSLDTNLKDNLQHIIKNFKLRLWPKNFTMPKWSAEFWNMKQEEHQNLEDFVTHYKMVGKRIEADEKTVLSY